MMEMVGGWRLGGRVDRDEIVWYGWEWVDYGGSLRVFEGILMFFIWKLSFVV